MVEWTPNLDMKGKLIGLRGLRDDGAELIDIYPRPDTGDLMVTYMFCGRSWEWLGSLPGPIGREGVSTEATAIVRARLTEALAALGPEGTVTK